MMAGPKMEDPREPLKEGGDPVAGKEQIRRFSLVLRYTNSREKERFPKK